MSIAFKEGLKIPPQAMEQIILGANQDVRQVCQHFVSKILFNLSSSFTVCSSFNLQ